MNRGTNDPRQDARNLAKIAHDTGMIGLVRCNRGATELVPSTEGWTQHAVREPEPWLQDNRNAEDPSAKKKVLGRRQTTIWRNAAFEAEAVRVDFSEGPVFDRRTWKTPDGPVRFFYIEVDGIAFNLQTYNFIGDPRKGVCKVEIRIREVVHTRTDGTAGPVVRTYFVNLHRVSASTVPTHRLTLNSARYNPPADAITVVAAEQARIVIAPLPAAAPAV